MSAPKKSFTVEELGRLGTEFLGPMDREKPFNGSSQYELMVFPLWHFMRWLVDPNHPYHDDGHIEEGKAPSPETFSKEALQRTYALEELGRLTKEFLKPFDQEHPHDFHSEYELMAFPLWHFIRWLGDRDHHYHDDGYILQESHEAWK